MVDGASVAASNRVPPWVRQVSMVCWSFVGFAATLAIVVVAMGTLRTLVIPLVLAVFLAVVFAPAVSWLAARRVPRGLGAVLVLFLIGLAATVSVLAVVDGIIDKSDTLATRFDEVIVELEDLVERSDLTDAVDSMLSSVEDSGSVVGTGFGSAIGPALSSGAAVLSGLLLGAILLYYLLKDGPDLAHQAAARGGAGTARVLDHAAGSIRSYMKGRTILAAVQAVLIGAGAAVLGVPLAFAIGLVNFIGGYIPYIGGLIGGAFAVLMAFAAGGPVLALIVLALVLLVSVGLENLLEPKLLGDTLKMHPIVILFATVMGGLFVGIVGMFLAAPAVAIVKAAYGELRDAGFFADPDSATLDQTPTTR